LRVILNRNFYAILKKALKIRKGIHTIIKMVSWNNFHNWAAGGGDVNDMLAEDFDFEVADAFNQMVPIENEAIIQRNRSRARSRIRNAYRRAYNRRRHRAQRQAMVMLARSGPLDAVNSIGRFLGQRDIIPRNTSPNMNMIDYAPGGRLAPTGPPQNEATNAIWGATSRAAFPANHHSGHSVSNPRRGVGVNTNTMRQISNLIQRQTGGNVFYNKLN
jgi:hypothetical protein